MSATPEPETAVVFRVFTGRDGGDVIALFPELPGTRDPFTCLSYQRVGQHGSADVAILRRGTRPATASESAPLAQELRGIGYNLRELRRTHRAHFGARCAAI